MKTFSDIIAKAKAADVQKIAIAGKPNEELSSALDTAVAMNLVEPVVFKTALEASKAVQEGRADILIKGSVDTKEFMQAVLDKTSGLRSGKTISHIALFEAFGRLMLLTDGGIVPNPTLEDKVAIVENAIPVANALGIECPRVAVLAAVEKVNEKMAETVDAAKLTEMGISGCTVYGPLAVDNAVDAKAAAMKGVTNPVAGNADILLVPSVLVGNIMAKSILYFANVQFAGLVAGTSKPVAFLSRSDSAETRLNTIALSVLISASSMWKQGNNL